MGHTVTSHHKAENALRPQEDRFMTRLPTLLPPHLATQILDTDVNESWLPAIAEFESRLMALKARMRVKAAKDLAEVGEGLRIVVHTFRSYFLFASIYFLWHRLRQN